MTSTQAFINAKSSSILSINTQAVRLSRVLVNIVSKELEVAVTLPFKILEFKIM